jgi:hypothetical protein
VVQVELRGKPSLRGFYETAGGVKVFFAFVFPSLEVFAFAFAFAFVFAFVFAFAFAFAFVLVFQIHLGLLYALILSRSGSVPVGARW